MKILEMRVLILLGMFALVPGYPQQSSLSAAEVLLKQGRTEDALAMLLELHRSEPSNANLCQQIGIAYTQLQDISKAEIFFAEAVRLNPRFLGARKNLATVLWFLDRKDESEREFQAVTKALPEDPVPHLYLGLAAHGRGEYTAAKIQFEKAGELASKNPEVLPAVLESYLASHDLSLPAEIEDWVIQGGDPDPALLTRLGALFLEYGYADRASAILEKLIAVHKESAEVWRMLAEAKDRLGKPEEAYGAYSRSIEADANAEDTYVALAEFASAHGNNDYALQVIDRGLEHRPQSAALLFEQGLLWALKGDRKQAEASFLEAGRLKPGWALPLMALGVSQLESGNAMQAAIVFQKARSVDPGDYRVHYLYATALARDSRNSAENRAEAVRALHQAIQLNPKDARSFALLGQLELDSGKPERAEAEWRAALKIDPENPTALYQLGLAYQRQGKATEAKRLLDKFRILKAKKHGAEESLVQILRVAPGNSALHRPTAASDSSTRER